MAAAQTLTDRLRDDFAAAHPGLSSISSATRVLIGYPGKLLDEQYIMPDTLAVSLNTSDYFLAMTQLVRHQRRMRFAQVGRPLSPDDSTGFQPLKPQLVGSRNENALLIPLAALQEPLIIPGSEAPAFSIFATYGTAVLNLLAKVYWQEQAATMPLLCFEAEFRKHLAENFQNIEFSGDLINSVSIADALLTAEYSYRRWKDPNASHIERNLPIYRRMDVMEEFYVAAGTMYCSREGFQVGSFYEAVVNTAFSMSQDFTKHFGCRRGDPMYKQECMKNLVKN
ncbi:unnamed protein product, partial [Mesorhabditis spiculigera]